MNRFLLTTKWACVFLPALLLSACADRQGSVEAAMALADAAYPGQLELFDTHMQKDRYDVTLAVKGDPYTRIRFSIDADPSRCHIGAACEERLHRAYAAGMAAGAKLKALNTAFQACGVTALGMHDNHVTPSFRTIIELDLDAQDQQPALDRLSPCVAAFRQALPADATADQRSLAFRILLPGSKGAAKPVFPFLFEKRLDSSRIDEVSYQIAIGPDEQAFRSEKLAISHSYLSRKELRDRLAEAARQALTNDARGGYVPKLTFLTGTRLDSDRLDVIRTYILACSEQVPGQGPCKTDIAVWLRYDLTRDEITEQAVLRDIRDRSGRTQLPRLPGRGAT